MKTAGKLAVLWQEITFSSSALFAVTERKMFPFISLIYE